MIKNDYKPRKLSQPIFSEKKRFSRAPTIMIGVSVVLIIWGMGRTFFGGDEVTQPEPEQPTLEIAEQTDEKQLFEIPLDLGDEGDTESTSTQQPATTPRIAKQPARTTSKAQQNQMLWKSSKIRSGDSTARVFQRYKLSATDLHNIMQLGKQTKALERVQAGHIFEYAQNSEGELLGVRYHIDSLNTLEVLRKNDQWQAQTHTKPVEVREASASGVIDSSLFLAGKEAGLSDSLVMELAGIFGWDIDFILDIRQGDSFTLIYEEKFVEGEKYANGNILAAEFVNQGKSFKAIRYTDTNGDSEYYSPEGLSMRKAFLRAPLDFSYVSSNFNPKRFHPVLKRVKPHRGIDYKAPRGTPIKAAGDGKVIRSAYDKYNGHHVFIQHGQKYTTKYLHFTKRLVKTGQRVKQGQIIGTLGSTGMVTGAHLHYEFLVNGVHRNPRTVDLPDAEPIRKSERERFFRMTQPLIAQLETRSNNSEYKVAEAD